MHFSKENSASIRAELLAEGKDASLGAHGKAVSAKWKGLTEEESQKYHEMAKTDKERYQTECRERDAKVLAEQEARRAKNSLTTTDTRARESTLKASEVTAVKASEPKKKRELSEKLVKERDERRAKKAAEESNIKTQIDEQKAKKAEQVG